MGSWRLWCENEIVPNNIPAVPRRVLHASRSPSNGLLTPLMWKWDCTFAQITLISKDRLCARPRLILPLFCCLYYYPPADILPYWSVVSYLNVDYSRLHIFRARFPRSTEEVWAKYRLGYLARTRWRTKMSVYPMCDFFGSKYHNYAWDFQIRSPSYDQTNVLARQPVFYIPTM